MAEEPVAHTTRPKKWMPWKFQTVGLRAASCNLKAGPKQLGSVWIRAFDENQTQTQQVSVGCCSSLLRCSGWGSPNLTPGWRFGIGQDLERIRADKARQPGPPKEDCTGSRKFAFP